MLSRGAIGVPQPGHRDRGRTIDSLFGTRSTTTVRKLPNAKPNRAATNARKAVSTAGRSYARSGGVPGARHHWHVVGTLPELDPLHSIHVTICHAAATGFRKNGGDWYFMRWS